MKIFFSLIFLLYTRLIFAQDTLIYSDLPWDRPEKASRIEHMYKDVIISASPDVLFNTPNGLQFGGGLKLRMYLGKNVSFESHLIFSKSYLIAGPGLVGLPIWIFGLLNSEENTFTEFLAGAALALLSAEHISFHIPAGGSTELSPYISLLKLKQSYVHGTFSDPGTDPQQICLSTGLSLDKYFKRFVFSPYIEYNYGYTDHKSGINAGIWFGYYFYSKGN